MADETIAAVRFVTPVTFNVKENKHISASRDHCTLSRAQGGIEARSAKGERIFIPFSNICFVQYAKAAEKPEQPKAEA